MRNLPDDFLLLALWREWSGNMAPTNPSLAFAQRAETFGFDKSSPWALPALRLLFHAPRVFEPLRDSWEYHFPGTKAALERLVALGFVAHQGPVRVDVRTGTVAEQSSKPVARYRITAKGKRLLSSATEDLRELEDQFPRMAPANAEGVLDLLAAFNVATGRAPEGVSVAYAAGSTTLADRTARWWVPRLVERGYLRQLDIVAPDARVAVPQHWRVTRPLCRQLLAVTDAFPDPWASLRREFRLKRSRFLGDIDPGRVGVDGATDYDHDVHAQRICAQLLQSPHAQVQGIFALEPRLVLGVDMAEVPWEFTSNPNGDVFYQPDGVFIDNATGTSRRNIVEYERRQSRRDAWAHMERFLGHVALHTFAFEPAVLRFVLDSPGRERSYVELIEAFADYLIDHPDRTPENAVQLAVTSWPRLSAPGDPLGDDRWFRLELPSNTTGAVRCRIHSPTDSPYDSYFTGTFDEEQP